MYTILQEMRASGVECLHLCLSSPLVFSFALGMALGTLAPVTLYHLDYGSQRYIPVLNLESLRKEG